MPPVLAVAAAEEIKIVKKQNLDILKENAAGVFQCGKSFMFRIIYKLGSISENNSTIKTIKPYFQFGNAVLKNYNSKITLSFFIDLNTQEVILPKISAKSLTLEPPKSIPPNC